MRSDRDFVVLEASLKRANWEARIAVLEAQVAWLYPHVDPQAKGGTPFPRPLPWRGTDEYRYFGKTAFGLKSPEKP